MAAYAFKKFLFRIDLTHGQVLSEAATALFSPFLNCLAGKALCHAPEYAALNLLTKQRLFNCPRKKPGGRSRDSRSRGGRLPSDVKGHAFLDSVRALTALNTRHELRVPVPDHIWLP